MTARRVASLATLLLAIALPCQAHAADLLPDFDQATPEALEVTADNSGAVPRFHLGFNSAVDNVGAGPLILDAHRDSQDQPQMTADQTVLGSDGSRRTIAGVGQLQYVYSEDHNHWHYLGFDHYELRRASDYAFVAPDQKTGFCLGDRYETFPGATQPGKPADPPYTAYCGRTQPELLSLEEGLSVGYGDVYFATLEGQFVDVTGVAAGQYYLVHRVNADHRLLERDYSNDSASLLLDLSWPDGMTAVPSVKILRGCAEHDFCPGEAQLPPPLSRAAAERYARAALARVLRFSPRGFTIACKHVAGKERRSCTAAGVHGTRRYAARVSIALERSKQAILSYRYDAAITVAGRSCQRARRSDCGHALRRRAGVTRIGKAPGVAASAAVAQPRQRLVALDDPLLDGVRLRPVVHEVPRLVRDPLGGLRGGLPAQ
ncbi:MAG: hypothetical protein QOG46_2170 [Pseudonocardiales bacterium]|nr:hypothetical protein [Pseudonocardiales bacterium]